MHSELLYKNEGEIIFLATNNRADVASTIASQTAIIMIKSALFLFSNARPDDAGKGIYLNPLRSVCERQVFLHHKKKSEWPGW